MMVAVALTLALASVAKHPVEFRYHDSTAKLVQISGDFDAWSKPSSMHRDNGDWIARYELPDDARIEYKFIVDGKWITDPANPHRINNGVGGENSIWQGPKYTFRVDDGEPKHPFHRSELKVGGRTIVVYAPEEPTGLPVLIYGDGETYENPGKIQNFVANLAEADKIRPAVLVLIPPIDRMKEYGDDWKAYGSYVFDQVLPAVRDALPVGRKATDVFMGGSSMGGLISLRLAEEFPDKLAGGIHCQSAAIQWDAMYVHYDDVTAPAKLKKIASTTRVWMDWGEFEDGLTTANERLAKTLNSMGRRFGSVTTNEGHNWTAWRHRMEAGLTYLLGPSR